MSNPALDYARKVVDGDIVAGSLIVKACERHLNDLAHGNERGLFFDESKAQAAIDFFEHFLHHFKGRWAKGACTCPHACSKLIKLEPWQRFGLASVFGWQRHSDELGYAVRRFNTVYKQVARKNAKTTVAAGVGLIGLTIDDEPGAEIYSAATKRDQAKEVWRAARVMAQLSSELSSMLKLFNNSIVYEDTHSRFEPLSSDANTLDGLNPSVALVDELQAHKNAYVRNVLESGQGARDQPLLYQITTAGFLLEDSVAKSERDYGESIVKNVEEDDSFLALIYEMDEDDDLHDPSLWVKSNPNLNVSVLLSEMQRQHKKSLHSPSAEIEFLTKRLDLWVEQAEAFVPVDAWDACPSKIEDGELRGRECFGGFDLSSTTDLTAFVLVFPPARLREPWKARYFTWLPERTLAKKEIKERQLRQWAKKHTLTTTDGSSVDYNAIRQSVNTLGDVYAIRSIGFDPWNAMQLATDLQDDGFDLVQVRQGPASLSEPMKYWLKLVLDRDFNHGAHPIARHCVVNLKVRRDANGNVAPDREKSTSYIDLSVATVIAMQRAISSSKKPTRYEKGGVRFLSG